MIDNGHSEQPATTMTKSVGGFAHDITTLAELQVKLFFADLKEALQHLTWPLVMMLVGAVLAFASLPVVLMGIAYTLIQRAGLAVDVAFLITAAGATFIAAATCLFGWSKMRRSFSSLERSRDELARNVSWIKSALKNEEL